MFKTYKNMNAMKVNKNAGIAGFIVKLWSMLSFALLHKLKG